MALVNPTVAPTNPENFMRYSQDIRPGEDIKPRGQEVASIKPTGITHVDESGKYAYGQTGSLIEGGAKVLDFIGKGIDAVIKSDIDTKVQSAGDEEKRKYTEQLLLLKAAGPGRAVGSLLSEDPEGTGGEIPEDVTAAIEQAGTLKAAASAGKISGTHYLASLESKVVKPVRDKYPGYREYIDAEVAKITGHHPANDYIKALVQDINRADALARGQANKIETLMMKHMDIPEMPAWRADYRKTGDFETLFTRISRHESVKGAITFQTNLWKFDEANQAHLKLGATNTAHFSAASEADRFLNNVELKAGIGTPQTISKTLTELATGGRTIPSEKLLDYKMQVDEAVRQYKASVFSIFNVPVGKDRAGREFSHASILGEDATKIMNQHAFHLEKIAEALGKPGGDWTAINYHSNKIKAKIDDAQMYALSDKGIKNDLVMSVALEKLNAPLVTKSIQEYINKSGMLPRYKEMLERFTTDSVTQIDPAAPAGTIPSVSLKDSVEAAERAGITKAALGPGSARIAGDFYRKLTSWTDNLANTDYPEREKQKIAIWAFHPEANRGLLGKFGEEGLDFYRRMTSSGIVDSIFKMPREIQQHYYNWTENSFNELVKSELSVIQNYSNIPGVTMGWDSNRLELKPKFQYVPGGISGYDRKVIEGKVERINDGLTGLKELYTASGVADVEGEMIRMLRLYHFDPTTGQTEGFPKQIIESIIKAREDAAIAEEERKARGQPQRGSGRQ